MSIMLGNLNVRQIEERAGVEFSDKLKELLSSSNQSEASNIKDGKWHCFDLPFVMVCGGRPLAQEIYDHLKADSSKFKEQLQIMLST